MFLDKFGSVYPYRRKQHGYSFYYRFWRDVLFEYACKIFSYTGEIAKQIPQKEIEIMLLSFGFCGVLRNNEGNLICAPANLWGISDYFNLFTNFNFSTPKEAGSREIGKDGVIVDNNSIRNPITETIHAYACQLAHIDTSLIICNINNRDTAVYTAINSNLAETARDYRSKVYEGKLDVMVDKGFDTIELRDNLTTHGSNGHLRELIDCRNELLNSYLELIGVKRANTKKERQITDEISANDALLKLNIKDMLECRQKGLKEIEQLFGVSGEVICNANIGEEDVEC